MSKILGNLMETRALKFLEQQGLQLLKRNYHSRYGEIDLIMHEHGTLVFIEVRYRHNLSHGNASESIDVFKQKKIYHTAERFLQERSHYQSQPCRFDVIAFNRDNNKPQWIKDAF